MKKRTSISRVFVVLTGILCMLAVGTGISGQVHVIGEKTTESVPATAYAPAPGMNTLPVAVASGPYTGMIGVPVRFDASESYDTDGTGLCYSWNFGDGTTGSGISPSHVYAADGVFTVVLVVFDGIEESDLSITSSIISEAQTLSVADLDLSTAVRKAWGTAFTKALAAVTIQDSGGAPVEGATVAGHWSGAASGSAVAVTDASGTAVCESDAVTDANGGDFVFIIDDVVKEGWRYDRSANGDFNGDGTCGETCSTLSIDGEAGLPVTAASLGPAFPNPANPQTTIPYTIGETGRVSLTIYNTLGQPVRTLVDSRMVPGAYAARWDGRNDRGCLVASGVYLYRLRTGNSSVAKLMHILK